MKTVQDRINTPANLPSDAPSALEVGSTLYYERVALGLGQEAIVEVAFDGPKGPVPDTAAQWEETRDYPSATAYLSLPGDGALRVCLRTEGIVFEEGLRGNWGSDATDEPGFRHRSLVFAAPTLTAAVELALARISKELAPLQAHLAKRAQRIEERNARHSAGLDMTPLAA